MQQKSKEEALAGGGSGARGDSGSPSDPKRPKYGRGVNPAEMRPEVGDEMFKQGKKANDAYKMITGKEPPKKSKGSLQNQVQVLVNLAGCQRQEMSYNHSITF